MLKALQNIRRLDEYKQDTITTDEIWTEMTEGTGTPDAVQVALKSAYSSLDAAKLAVGHAWKAAAGAAPEEDEDAIDKREME